MNLLINKLSGKVIIAFIITALLSISSNVYAQHSDAQLALKYFQNREFEKAAVLYEKLYEDTRFKSHRDSYLRCLNELRDFETAEKFIKKELRRNRNDIYLTIDLGMLYLNLGKKEESEQEFNKVLNLAMNSRNNVIAASNSFQIYRNYKWAERIYLEGAARLRDNFDYELGNIYFMQRDYEKMMKSYLSDLKRNPQRLNIIQSRLQHLLTRDIDQSFDDIVEQVLLEDIQKNPNNSVVTNLLVWQYTQTGKFEAALDQLIAIDRRNTQDGFEIIEFSKILKNNLEYDLSIKALEYVMSKGKDRATFSIAYIDYLNILFLKYTGVMEPEIGKMQNLEQLLNEGLNIVRRRDAFPVLYSLASLKAFYLGKFEEASVLLLDEINNKRLNVADESLAKLLLGDIYMLNNNPWEATLIYAQVEKSNAESTLGHEARFRRAKLAYYSGEFEWAQAQLVVLKGSTSKLIANDALELSVFISDNFNLDTTHTTLQLFARADFAIYTKQYTEALKCLDSILLLFPSHKLTDNVLYRKAEIYEAVGDYSKAIDLFEEVSRLYYFDLLADKALFRYAQLNEKQKNYSLAEEAYFKIVMDFPSSIYAVEARNNLRILRDKNLIN